MPSKDYKTKVYILQCIAEHPETGKKMNVNKSIDYVSARFKQEYQWRVDQVGEHVAMTDWLQGLALPIEYMNHNILKLGIEWGYLAGDASETKEDQFLERYWRFMALRVLQLIRGYNVPKEIKTNDKV